MPLCDLLYRHSLQVTLVLTGQVKGMGRLMVAQTLRMADMLNKQQGKNYTRIIATLGSPLSRALLDLKVVARLTSCLGCITVGRMACSTLVLPTFSTALDLYLSR